MCIAPTAIGDSGQDCSAGISPCRGSRWSRLPESYVGGELCWRGEVMWEGADEHFTRWPDGGCRAVEAGRRRPARVRHCDQARHARHAAHAALAGADSCHCFRCAGRNRRARHRGAAGSVQNATHSAAGHPDLPGALGDRHRRRQHPRRRAAVRRRRRWAVLRRSRADDSAAICWPATVCESLRGGESVFYYGGPACAISVRSSTSCSAKAISAIFRLF